MNIAQLIEETVEQVLADQETIECDHRSGGYQSPWWNAIVTLKGQTDASNAVLERELRHAVDEHYEMPCYLFDCYGTASDPQAGIVPTLEAIRSWRADPVSVAAEAVEGATPLYGVTASGNPRHPSLGEAHYVLAALYAALGCRPMGIGDRQLGRLIGVTHRAANATKRELRSLGIVHRTSEHVYVDECHSDNRVEEYAYNWSKCPDVVVEVLARSFAVAARILDDRKRRRIQAARDGGEIPDPVEGARRMWGSSQGQNQGRGERLREGSRPSGSTLDPGVRGQPVSSEPCFRPVGEG